MKRTLALVLALVLVLGMMAVPVAADFTDSRSIKYTEAVEVMSAIGVINGFEDGSFDPDGNLTREQAAKVMAYMLLGAKNADALKATSAPFDDVAADRWSAGYIAYAVNEGIINGRDDKTFDPTGNVTGYEFAKLLLGALGYSSKIEEFTGATWAINVAKIALDIELFEGNDGANYNAAITREEAALYAFNTLSATLVEYKNKGTDIDLGNGIVISTGASEAEEVEYKGDKNQTIKNDDYVQFAEKYFSKLTLNSESGDDFGRPSRVWKFDKKEVGTYSKEAEISYTTGTKGKEIYADLGKPKDVDFTYYVDGRLYYDKQATGAIVRDVPRDVIDNVYSGFVIASGNEVKIGGNGTLVEVFEDGDDYIVTVVNTYAGELESWTEADDSKDREESVSVNALTDIGSNGSLDGEDFETTAFSEADADDGMIVYFTAAWNGTDYTLQSVVEAELVTAFITSTTGESSFVAGGKSYKYNKTVKTFATYNKDNDDADIYLDSYGYAIYIDMDAAAVTEYAYLEQTRKDTQGWDDSYLAKLVLANGEVVSVTVDKYDGKDPSEYVGGFEKVYDKIVKYTVNKDGEYKLKEVEIDDYEDAKIERGVANLGNGYYANSKTIFILAKEKDNKLTYSVYTGIKNVPDVKGSEGTTYLTYAENGTTATVVVVLGAKTSNVGSSSNIFAVVKENPAIISGADYDPYFEAAAVVDGEIVTLKIAVGSDAAERFTYEGSIVGGTYHTDDYTLDEDGLVTDFGDWLEYPDVDYGLAAKKIEAGNITLKWYDYETQVFITEEYVVADNAKFFVIDYEEAKITRGSSSSVRANHSLEIVLDDGEAVTIYVAKTAVEIPTGPDVIELDPGSGEPD